METATEPMTVRPVALAAAVRSCPEGSPARDRALQPIRLLGLGERQRVARVVAELDADLGTVRRLASTAARLLVRFQRRGVRGRLSRRPDPWCVRAAVDDLAATMAAICNLRQESLDALDDDLDAVRRSIQELWQAADQEPGQGDVAELAAAAVVDVDESIRLVRMQQTLLASMTATQQRLVVALADWTGAAVNSRVGESLITEVARCVGRLS